jgi:hypothetical protein
VHLVVNAHLANVRPVVNRVNRLFSWSDRVAGREIVVTIGRSLLCIDMLADCPIWQQTIE